MQDAAGTVTREFPAGTPPATMGVMAIVRRTSAPHARDVITSLPDGIHLAHNTIAGAGASDAPIGLLRRTRGA
jgi:hypothetical protein